MSKELEEAREKIGKVICCLSDDPKECDYCATRDGCPNSWLDVKEEVDQILNLKGDGWSIAIIGTDPNKSYAIHSVQSYAPVIWQADEE